MTAKKRLIITIDKALHKDIKIRAAQNDTTMNAIINRALIAYNFENEKES